MPLDQALGALYAGDRDALGRVLAAEPHLVRARVATAAKPYNGYFFQATLLHHVAGNPTIRPLPASIVEQAALILDRGAEVDSATHAGPDQPTDPGWSTLGLAATSLDLRNTGHQIALIDLLLDRGADVDFMGGYPLIGALYYDEATAAQHLVQRGAPLDLIAAAGLGRIDAMERFLDPDGTPRPGARRLARYSQVQVAHETPDDVCSLALVYACMGGHLETALPSATGPAIRSSNWRAGPRRT